MLWSPRYLTTGFAMRKHNLLTLTIGLVIFGVVVLLILRMIFGIPISFD
jgi:hypothetical protein